MSKVINWKPSENKNTEGYITKTYAHPKGDGDMIIPRDKARKKWSKRLTTLLGTAVDLTGLELFPDWGFDVKFKGADGRNYRAHQVGEGARSAYYSIIKYK